MLGAKLLVLAGFCALQAAMVGVALPLRRRQVPPNDTYGLRIAATRRDPDVWYEANARSARELIVTSLLLVPVAAALLLVPGLDAIGYLLACVGTWLAALAVGTWRSVRMARRLDAASRARKAAREQA